MKMVKAAALVSVLLLCSAPAFADNILAGQWYEFQFVDPTALVFGCVSCVSSSGGNSVYAPAGTSWTITTTELGMALIVTDAFIAVDQFTAYSNASLLGTTSAFSGTNPGFSDPEIALYDPNYSKGFFTLPLGVNEITIEHVAGIPGAAYFKVDAVPEPASLLLLGSGLAALAVLRRKK